MEKLLKLDGKSMKNKDLLGEAQLREKRARKYCGGTNGNEKVLPQPNLRCEGNEGPTAIGFLGGSTWQYKWI
jgi:hypothetical protein